MAENTETCNYCRTVRPQNEMKRGRITCIERGHVVENSYWYCADKPCHGHDQMAHEG